HVRTRAPLVSRAALLDLGDPRGAAAPDRALRARGALRVRRSAPAPARGGRARGAALSRFVPEAALIRTVRGRTRSAVQQGRFPRCIGSCPPSAWAGTG